MRVSNDGSQSTRGSTPPTDDDVAHGRLQSRDVRRAELVEAAVRVIIREGPNASMAQMAAEAGVSKPILYRYFCDRADLVDAVAAHTLADIDAALARVSWERGSVRAIVESVVDTYLGFIEGNAPVYRFLISAAAIEAVDDQMIVNRYVRATGTRVAAVLCEALGLAGRDTGPSEVWGFGISGMVHTVGSWWLESGALSREVVCSYLTALVVDGLPTAERPLPGHTTIIGCDVPGIGRVPMPVGGAW